MTEEGKGRWAHRTKKARAQWDVGLRVVRRDTGEQGLVVEVNGKVKVKWDGGRTSYFRNGEDVNVKRHRPPRKQR